MKTTLKPMTMTGRKWFEKTNGNTYHTVEVSIINDDNRWETIYYSDVTYGYGEQWKQTGNERLKENGYNIEDYAVLYNEYDFKRKRDIKQ